MSSKMLRFFSRRKIKGGRAEQKAGVGGRRAPGRLSKHALPCNIMLLDGSDLALEIGVSFPPLPVLLLTCLGTCAGLSPPTCLASSHESATTPSHLHRTQPSHSFFSIFSLFFSQTVELILKHPGCILLCLK